MVENGGKWLYQAQAKPPNARNLSSQSIKNNVGAVVFIKETLFFHIIGIASWQNNVKETHHTHNHWMYLFEYDQYIDYVIYNPYRLHLRIAGNIRWKLIKITKFLSDTFFFIFTIHVGHTLHFKKGRCKKTRPTGQKRAIFTMHLLMCFLFLSLTKPIS